MKKRIILQRFGKRIKNLRKIYKMSQEKLAEKADLSTNFVGSLERGEKEPKLVTLVKIANAFGITVGELLSYPDDKRIKSAKPELLGKAAEVLEITLDLLEGHRRTKEK
jgi:transcriptional regulator with XRE-family HTH domain